jgi:hypothetical protein
MKGIQWLGGGLVALAGILLVLKFLPWTAAFFGSVPLGASAGLAGTGVLLMWLPGPLSQLDTHSPAMWAILGIAALVFGVGWIHNHVSLSGGGRPGPTSSSSPAAASPPASSSATH